jgi:hypothetical protein
MARDASGLLFIRHVLNIYFIFLEFNFVYIFLYSLLELLE